MISTGRAHGSGGAQGVGARLARALAALARDAGVRWADDACYRLGAALAYYALFSLFPLVLLALTAIGFILGNDDSVRHKLLGSIAIATSPEARALLDQTLQSMQEHRTARGVGTLVALVTLLLGASGVFSELQSSLDFIWRVKPTPSKGMWSFLAGVLRAKAFSFAIVVVAAATLLASLVVNTALAAVGETASTAWEGRLAWRLVEPGVSAAFLTVLLAAIYRIVPQTTVRWSDVFGAAFLTSLLLACLKALLAWYLARVSGYAAYGAVGGVLGLLTWIYAASLVLFYGAEFSRLYAERFGSLRPVSSDAPHA
jgi:membrane protein